MKKTTGINCILLFIITIAVLSCAGNDMKQALNAINETALRSHTIFLGDDLLSGRAPGSTGSIIAQRYIASQMQLLGLKPGLADTSYYQQFDMIAVNMKPGIQLKVTGKQKSINLNYYDEFVAFPGVQMENIRVQDAEVVFAGYGIQSPEYDWDDFKDVDVKGKVLLIMNNDPDNGDPNFFGGKARLYYGRWSYKYEQAARKGAVGAIIIHTAPSAGYPWKVVQTSWSGTLFELPQIQESPLQYKAWVTEDVAYRMTELAGKNLDELRLSAENRDFKPVSLGITMGASLNADYRALKAANIIGVLPGSDPELRKEAVVLTAHYDHLGIGNPVEGDSIYNGALDNALGVASILAIADAFRQMDKPPKRSLLFLAVDGEESGLLGSQYYAEHPTFPPSKMTANLNVDMGNIWGKTKDIAIIGFGKSTIDKQVEEVAKAQGRTVLPDLMPEKGFFYRSDQFNFAKIGVPAIFPETGQDFIGIPEEEGKKLVEQWIEEHYHQPSDEYSPDWNLSGQIQDVTLIFQLALRLANNKEMPVWLPGDEFEAARLVSISNKK